MFFESLYARPKRTLSFEFFPPRNELDLPATERVIASLASLHPSFVTITSGADANKRSLSRAMVRYSRIDLGLPVIAHQTCWGLSREEIDESLADLQQHGINLVLALRGDPAKNFTPDDLARRGFENALEFTRYIANLGPFEVAVAGYPETHRDAASPTSDLEYLKQKIDVGAKLVLTQLFFEPSVYFRFLEKTAAVGIDVPIVPGILPITGASQLERFVGLTGASVPQTVRDAVLRYADNPAGLAEWGAEFAAAQCRALVEGGAPGIHLYTLNKEAVTAKIASAIAPLL
jgi:methylenetetrahydrofolate reductase (NADPH)